MSYGQNSTNVSRVGRATRARIGVLWRGDPAAPESPGRHAARLAPILDALAAAGMESVALTYLEENEAALRESLMGLDGVLVWVNPIEEGRTRAGLDNLLREAAARGLWVSAHPDTIAVMGVKDVLFRTQELSWGCRTYRHDTLDALMAALPKHLQSGPRVLKPLRGNDGRGVMKISVTDTRNRYQVQFAADDRLEERTAAGLARILSPIFADQGAVIDQAFAPASRGMVRCYMALDRVIGFGAQEPRIAPGQDPRPAFGMNSAKAMVDADWPAFRDLHARMESEWAPGLLRLTGLKREALPALWDADFLHRDPAETWRSPYVLCEINVSCVSPFPAGTPGAVAAAVRAAMTARAA